MKKTKKKEQKTAKPANKPPTDHRTEEDQNGGIPAVDWRKMIGCGG